MNGLGLALDFCNISYIRCGGFFEVLTEQSESLRENGRKNGRAPEDKYGRYRYNIILTKELLEEVRGLRRDFERHDRKMTRAHRYDTGLEPGEIQDVVAKDSSDQAILEVLREAGAEGKLPKDIWQDVRRHGLKYHHITRRIKRMNRRLQEHFDENVAEKIGARWRLSPFMRDNWLAKMNEVGGDEEVSV